jgi:membrane protein required for colicin V production
MIIDVIFVFLMILSAIKGFRNGFIVAVFSFLGIFIGLAAALKLSTLVAGWLHNSTNIAAAWLPFLSFLLIMIGVILLVRLGALFIQTAMEAVLMGWINKISGVILYAALYITLFSVVLFYAEKIHWIKPDTFVASHVYSFIKPWGPKAIEWFGAIVPWFKGMFADLSQFFEKLPSQVK